jgi:hypothetical protein
MIAAVFAGVAATVAWIAAQRQIRYAAVQNSVVAYAALRDVLRGVEEEVRANEKIGTALALSQTFLEAGKRQEGEPSEVSVQMNIREISMYLKGMGKGIDDLNGSTTFPWGGAPEREMRAQLIKISTKYQRGIRLTILKSHGEHMSIKKLEEMVLNDDWKQVKEANRQFSNLLVAERERIIALMDRQFAGFTKFS